MTINLNSPTTYTTAVLIGDTNFIGTLPDTLPTLTRNGGQPVSAALEIKSTNGAILMSRMTEAQRDLLNPTPGMMVYNTNVPAVQFRVDNAWLDAAVGPFVMNFQWNDAPVSEPMQPDNGYFAKGAIPVFLSLPTLMAFGSVVRVVNLGAGGFVITQNPGQSIRIGNQITTVETGTLESTDLGDSIEIICETEDTGFVVLSSMGNITVT